jgi:hypothetical protein
MPRRLALSAFAVLLLAIAATTGCGKSSTQPVTNPPPPTLPPGTPQNTSPQAAMLRFEAAYEYQALAEYAALFTANFRFAFSSQADPDLVAQYGATWSRNDERLSAAHLFDGFTNPQGTYNPPGSSITLTLNQTQIIYDPVRSDSAAFYKLVIVPLVDLELAIAGTDGFSIGSPHDFYLVRGDAAVLDPGQPADSLHWYLWRWDDKALPISAPGSLDGAMSRFMPSRAATWGQIKHQYR